MAQFQHQPDVARQILAVVQASDARWHESARKLDEIAHRFGKLEEQNQTIITEQRRTAEVIQEIHAAVRALHFTPADRSQLASSGSDLLTKFNRLRQDLAIPHAGSDAVIVAQDGSGKFTSIGQAVQASRTGDTIFVREGKYIESVILKKAVTLVGIGRREAVQVISNTKTTFTIETNDWKPIAFYNMTIRGGPQSDTDAIHVREDGCASLTLVGCDVIALARAGVLINSRRLSLSVHGSYFADGRAGIYTWCPTNIYQCVFSGQSESNIHLTSGSRCNVHESILKGGAANILIGQDSHGAGFATLTKCELSGSRFKPLAGPNDMEDFVLVDTRTS
jgi:hypothetical protein